MLQLAVRRLLIAIPTMLVIIAASFFLMHAAKGGPFDREHQLPDDIKRRVEAHFRLDQPVPVQLAYYLGDLAHGDLGPSMKYKDKSVGDIISEGLPTSMLLGLSSVTIALVLGTALGSWAAVRQNHAQDYLAMSVALIGVCMPALVTGPLLQLAFGVKLHWLPTAGLARDQYSLSHLILPIATLALPQIAVISRLMRASMIEALRSNAVRTARAKGLPEVNVVWRHALPIAALPVVSYLGPAIAGALTGSIVIEQTFGLPGVGRQFATAALNRDYTLVMGAVIVYAALIILMNLVVDLVYRALDPRARA